MIQLFKNYQLDTYNSIDNLSFGELLFMGSYSYEYSRGTVLLHLGQKLQNSVFSCIFVEFFQKITAAQFWFFLVYLTETTFKMKQ